jgi:NADPH:quinone reductase-like Zn-dependent oxidoreductase
VTPITAVRIHATSSPDVVQPDAVERAKTKPRQALVRVATADVNYADSAGRRGTYPPIEACDTVSRVPLTEDMR